MNPPTCILPPSNLVVQIGVLVSMFYLGSCGVIADLSVSYTEQMMTASFESLLTECLQESGNQKFVILIDKLISRIGFHRVIAGAVAHDSPTVSEEPTVNLTTSEVSYSRAWLAAEILCTWKWPGGSAFSSFLPLLSAYVISQDYSPAHGLLDSIVSILLDGALMHGESGELTPGNVWPGLYHEAESISEPFLRALIALLSTLFQKNIPKMI